MEESIRKYLIGMAARYADANGIQMTTVARRFHGSVHFFEDFQRGEATITLRKLDEMLDEFRVNWPPGLAWPKPPRLQIETPRGE